MNNDQYSQATELAFLPKRLNHPLSCFLSSPFQDLELGDIRMGPSPCKPLTLGALLWLASVPPRFWVKWDDWPQDSEISRISREALLDAYVLLLQWFKVFRAPWSHGFQGKWRPGLPTDALDLTDMPVPGRSNLCCGHSWGKWKKSRPNLRCFPVPGRIMQSFSMNYW